MEFNVLMPKKDAMTLVVGNKYILENLINSQRVLQGKIECDFNVFYTCDLGVYMVRKITITKYKKEY